MNAPTSSTTAGKPVSLESEVEAEVSKLVEQKISRLDAKRIRSSIVRLTSNSTDGLDSLSSELQDCKSSSSSRLCACRMKSKAHWPMVARRQILNLPNHVGERGDLAGALTA